MKHTKGKWFWVGENLRTKQQDDKSWQGTLVFHHTTSKEETKANRDLIASSPKLLKALNGILGYFSEYEDDYSEKLECFENARKVIAKAEGNKKNK